MQAKKTISAYYVDRCDDFKGSKFKPETHFLTNILTESYDVIWEGDFPNYLIFHAHDSRNAYEGYQQIYYDGPECVKIFITAENVSPDFNTCDYAIGFDYIDFRDRYIRCPYFFVEGAYDWLIEEWAALEQPKALERRFCSFTVSNGSFCHPNRDTFFHLLSEYKTVSSLGGHLRNDDALEKSPRNSGNWKDGKYPVLNQFKFAITFENTNHPGYTTEKIVDAFRSRTVPIYWGNPEIAKDFNPEAFINANDFDNLGGLKKEVMRIDQDDDAYMAMINSHPLLPEHRGENIWRRKLSEFIHNIVDQDISTARRRSIYGANQLLIRAKQKRQRKLDKLKKIQNLIIFWKR